MPEILSAAQMRAAESFAIEGGQVTGLELMERAGQGVVTAALRHWPELAAGAHHAAVFCGPGNNGGDGFVIARLLAGRGWRVTLFLYGDPARLPPDARRNHDLWAGQGAVHPWSPEAVAAARADLFVDALFGTGLSRPPPEAILAPMRALAGAGRMVAVDGPSGLDLDCGRALHAQLGAVRADLTVSFHRPKLGHFLGAGPDYCGVLRVADIGLASGGRISPTKKVILRAEPDRALLRKGAGHKYAYGHALILSGPAGHDGAARLAARGALRVGAGLVTLGLPEGAASGGPDAVMRRRVQGGDDLALLLRDRRLNAVILGPGLGLARAPDLVAAALRAGRAVVLDADGLSAFAPDPAALFAQLHDRCVLTPHEGEFARLFPDLDLRDPVAACRQAAARAGCTVLLKGRATLIAAPDGAMRLHGAVYDHAAPWLATAGSGDVLAGIIGGLLARGAAPLAAAAGGAWLHGAAARRFGPGLIADDLPDQLPAVFRDLGL